MNAAGKLRQRGFSFLELGIVIIILGVVFLFGLEGVTAIPAMRSVIVAHQIQGIQTAILQYLTDYGQMPGDDPAAAKRWRRPDAIFIQGTTPISFIGDGKIDGLLLDPNNATGEQYTAWRDLRLGGYLPGDNELVGQSARPENPFGGFYALAAANMGLENVLCATRVPGADAKLIDKKLDDANPSTGKLRASSKPDSDTGNEGVFSPDVEPYDPEKTYIICLPQLP